MVSNLLPGTTAVVYLLSVYCCSISVGHKQSRSGCEPTCKDSCFGCTRDDVDILMRYKQQPLRGVARQRLPLAIETAVSIVSFFFPGIRATVLYTEWCPPNERAARQRIFLKTGSTITQNSDTDERRPSGTAVGRY